VAIASRRIPNAAESTLKKTVFSYLKNIPGKRTNRKLVAFAIDDFGNIMLASKQARENLRAAGLNVEESRFTLLDGLENADDLAKLFEVLHSVKDQHGHPAVFTPFAMPANIHFEQIEKENYDRYSYELLPDTLNKLPGYEGTWQLWQEGIEKGFFVPQFHGREHLNLRLFETLLQQRDHELMQNLANRSYTAIRFRHEIPVGFTEAFSFYRFEEVENHKAIIADGLQQFEQVFGYKAIHFNAPGAREHSSLGDTMYDNGIRYLDADFIKKEHQGLGRYRKTYNPFGAKKSTGIRTVFRNAVFEPSLGEQSDWVNSCLGEIEIAFRCGKPAHISSHRVNFTSCIEPSVCDHGLRELQRLLEAIVQRWPEVEFVSTAQMCQIITTE
jgi:hypothetical protein